MWNTVLFDLDGTLTDSGPGITRCVQHALREVYGMDVPDLHDLDCFVGPPLKEQFLAFAGGTEEQADQAVASYRSRYNEKGIFENEVYPGIPEVLHALSQEHVTMALSSSKPTVFCKRILSHFGLDHYFTVILGSELDGRRTRKSEVVEEVIRSLGMEDRKSEVVLIGDRSYDVEGAREAGIDCVGVSYGYGSREELEEMWPACICDSTRELRNVLIGQLQAGMPPFRGDGANGFPGQETPDDRYAGYRNSAYGANQAPHENGEEQRYARYAKPTDNAYAVGYGERRRDPWPFMIWRIVYPYLVSSWMAYAVSFVLSLLYGLLYYSYASVEWIEYIFNNDTIYGGLIDALCLIIFIPLFRSDERKRRTLRGKGTILVRQKLTWKHILMIIFAVECVSSMANIIVNTIVYTLNPGYSEPQASFYTVGVLTQYLIMGILIPICEEYIFRGLIYRRIRDYFGPLPAILVTTTFFALVHQDLPTDIIVFCGGLMLALVYEHFGTLKASIIGHMTINICAIAYNNYNGQITYFMLYGSIALLCVMGAFSIYRIFVKDRRVNYV